MNTLKFISNKKLTTECHNPDDEFIKEIKMGEELKTFLCPVNFTIVVDSRCNSKCDFCIFHDSEKIIRVCDETYLRNLEHIFYELRNLPIEVTITGGEPTLFPERLVRILNLTKKYGLKHRTFSTNGIGLLNLYHGKLILQYMKECGAVRNINLSRMAIDQKENDSIFHSNTLTLDEIKTIAQFCHINDMDVRLSCNLMKSYIHTPEQILDYIRMAEEVNIENIIFRELVDYEKEFVSLNVIEDELNKQFIINKTHITDKYKITEFSFNHYHVKEYESNKIMKKTGIPTLVYQEGKLFLGWNMNKEIKV